MSNPTLPPQSQEPLKLTILPSPPTVVIDMRHNRIRIHKNTLHILGDPNYVRLLVNPEQQTFVIQCSSSQDQLSHRIKWKLISGKQCCEIYSKHLMEVMSSSFFSLKDQLAYRITGQFFAKEQLAHFSIKESVLIGGNESL